MARIVYLGNYLHPWCTEVHIADELEGLGHDVLRWQEPPGGGDLRTLRQLERAVGDFGAELLIWQRTWGLPRVEATQLWRRLERNGVKTASYHLDAYHGLARARKVKGDPFWTTGHVFTPDGNPEALEWFARLGINHHWLPPAVFSGELASVMPGRFRPEYAFDVVFVGSGAGTYHKEWPWRGRLLEHLAREYGPRFHHFGPGGAVRGQDLNDLYATARVVVGDSCFARPDQTYWSDRPFETFGRGGMLVFPRIDLLAEMIGGYPTYLVNDFEGVRLAVKWALDLDPEKRAELIAEKVARIEAGHTYRHRLGVALETMGVT